MHRRWRATAAALLAVALAAGCATDEARRVLRFGAEDAPRRVVWPAPPEVPRFLYVGELVGEANFRKNDELRHGMAGFFRWLAGIVTGEARPVVLQRPGAGAVDAQGRIYVTDLSRQAVFVFDQARGELLVWDKADGLANFIAPAGIALGPQGMVLVTDAELGIVARLDRQGNPGRAIGRGLLKRPTGLAYDASGRRIFVADTNGHDIKVFDDEGRLLEVIGRHGEGDGEFNYPTHLAFAHGELYVTDTMNNRVQVFPGGSGAVRAKFGARGLYVGNLVRPKGIASDGEGNIYVVESYYDHLLVFDREGRFLMAIGGSGEQPGKFYLPAGVWVDSRDRVFVADMFNGRVAVFQFLGGRKGGVD